MVGGQAVATAGSSMTSGMSMLAAARGAMPQHCHDAKKPPETRRPPVDNLMPQIMSSSKNGKTFTAKAEFLMSQDADDGFILIQRRHSSRTSPKSGARGANEVVGCSSCGQMTRLPEDPPSYRTMEKNNVTVSMTWELTPETYMQAKTLALK